MSATALLGATLGTVSGLLTLCGLSLLCKSCKKGKLERGDETDPEKAKPSILHTLTQVRPILMDRQPVLILNTDTAYKRTNRYENKGWDMPRVKCSDLSGRMEVALT